jgi:hypothetical protein
MIWQFFFLISKIPLLDLLAPFFCHKVAKIRHKKNPNSNKPQMVENDEARIR